MLKYFTRAEDRKFIHSEIRRVEKTTLDTRSRIYFHGGISPFCKWLYYKEFFFFFFLMYEQSSFLRFESLETG